ncbi:MAG TPA: DUF1015 domain-containing protein [Kofleriaceae bacterium]|nr:DUF1015 domain-containing protein [Kofleriaceae bacterium]
MDLAKVAAEPLAHVKERLAKGELVRDPTRAIYRYDQSFDVGTRTLTRKTLVCAVRLSPWSDLLVRPHEETNPTARDAAASSIAEVGAHCEPVFAGYRDPAREVERWIRDVDRGRPTLEVTTPDKTVHRLWRISSAEVIGKLRPLFAPKKLHVLDGHARYEGMLAYAQKLDAENLPQYSSANYGLACLVNLDEPALAVAPRHRLVRTNGIKRDAILEAAKRYFLVDQLAGAARDLAKQQAALGDSVAHQPAFVATFAGDADAYKLTLKPDVSLVSEGIEVHRAIQRYEPVVVEHLFMRRVVQTVASTTSTDAASVLDAVKDGAAIGVITRPLPLAEVLHADEVGALLPFGSTAFHPPLATMLAFVVDPDEDLV